MRLAASPGCMQVFRRRARTIPLLQPRLNVKVSQRQVLTPGLVQMVSVLALNKTELREMINGELVENPLLEEIEEWNESLEERSGREGDREQSAEQTATESARAEKDPFDEIDFGSYFQDFLDPGFRTASNFEDYDKPSFEQFLSQPGSLSTHLLWQLGSMTLTAEVRTVAECIVGNLNEDGYLIASDEELAAALSDIGGGIGVVLGPEKRQAVVVRAHEAVAQLDPVGVGSRDLRECLLRQLAVRRAEALGRTTLDPPENPFEGAPTEPAAAEAAPAGLAPAGIALADPVRLIAELDLAAHIVELHLPALQKRDLRELARLCRRTVEQVAQAVEAIRRLDPRPGQRFNLGETRLIEPDLAFVKRGEEYAVVMNEEDLPALRLNQGYRKMMREQGTERDVREYVKERYRSAIQLLRNIEQRKNTIVRTCEVIVRRQGEFLERGVEGLRPMMIKEIAEEIGVHPSTVSRAVANKYVHTTQGVYELRFFFSESVNGPEGGDLPLPLLKRRVKKLIEDEDARKPWTDDALAAELQRQGIQVTRRTVAKYREDMGIPSTHQRRQR